MGGKGGWLFSFVAFPCANILGHEQRVCLRFESVSEKSASGTCSQDARPLHAVSQLKLTLLNLLVIDSKCLVFVFVQSGYGHSYHRTYIHI